MLKNSRTLSKDDRETMLNIDAIYDEWRNTAVQEGREESDRASLQAMLVFKFGAIDSALEQVIPVLLALEPIARVQRVMESSRSELLEMVTRGDR